MEVARNADSAAQPDAATHDSPQPTTPRHTHATLAPPTPTPPPPPSSSPSPSSPSSSILAALSSVDSLMQPTILSTLRAFITQGGEPRVAIRLLTDHYEGRAEQINLLAHWLSLLPPHPPPAHTVTSAFHQLLLSSFSPHLADRLFSSLPSTPSWLLSLLRDEGWAEVFRTLAREYRGSLFLGFVERAMGGGGRGGKGGVEGVEQAPLEEWEKRVEDAVVSAVEEAGTPRTQAQAALLQLTAASESTYLYAQSLLSALSSLSQPVVALICHRLSEDLSLHAAAAHSSPLLFDFLLLHSERWPDASSALLAFYRAVASTPAEALDQPLLAASLPSLTPADAVKLYTTFASDSPPPSSLLHFPPLLASLIHSLFLPHSSLPTHQVIYLLCYASTAPSSSSPSLSSLIASLTSLTSLVTSKSWSLTPHLTLTHLHSSLSHPLLSSVSLYFIHSHLTSATYYDSTSATSLTPLLLSILAQLVSLSPLHHPPVFSTLTRAFSLPSSLDSLALITLRKQLLHLLLHLVLCGHLPALRWLRAQVNSMDHSLIRQFCMGLVGGVEGPMSLAVVDELLALLAEPEVRRGMKVMLAVLASEVGAAQQRRSEVTCDAPPEAAPAGERVRKRLRRMEGDGVGEGVVEGAPVVEEKENVGEVRRRPVKMKPFLSEFALDGSGDEVEDVRALAVYLVDLHAALSAGLPRDALYADDGGTNRADLVEHFDSFFAMIQPYPALV